MDPRIPRWFFILFALYAILQFSSDYSHLPNVVASHDSAADVISVKNSVIRQGLANVKAFLDGRTPPNLVFDGERRVGSLAGVRERAPVTWLP